MLVAAARTTERVHIMVAESAIQQIRFIFPIFGCAIVLECESFWDDDDVRAIHLVYGRWGLLISQLRLALFSRFNLLHHPLHCLLQARAVLHIQHIRMYE
jgi:hypothetical protein